ncbi:MAG: carboxypeptidase M32 [Nitrospiria bacterium]
MKTIGDLKPLMEMFQEIQYLSSTCALLSWDQETYMPPGGGEARAEQLSLLGALVHEKRVGEDMKSLLSRWLDLETGALQGGDTDWDEPARALLREVWHDYDRSIKLPFCFVRRIGKAASLSHQAWVEARQRNDFALFAPHLKKMVTLKREEAGYLGYDDSPYDPLLDSYEPGMTVKQIVPLFSALKADLIPILEMVVSSRVKTNKDFLYLHYPAERQLIFGREILKAMGYIFQNGRQDLSAHPFTTSFHPTDVRITTRVDEKDFCSSLFSSIHEGGHALYEQGLSPEYFGSPLGEAVSLGLHESQSRLWENCVGRSRPFWRHFYPVLQAHFPDQLKKFDLDAYYSAINFVRPSLIRVEADELTYNLHIMVRFEIEKALIEGDLDVDALPGIWGEKMKEHLGIAPESDTEGVLQDVHWSGGAFGYFPTYTLGNLYAAQIFRQAKKEIPEFYVQIEKGDLLPLKEWLNKKIHRWGRQYRSEDLLRRVTGEPLNPHYFIEGLHEKFGGIYGFS